MRGMARARRSPPKKAAKRQARDAGPPADDEKDSVLAWIEENRGKLGVGDMDLLLDLRGKPSELSAGPDTDDLGDDGQWIRKSGVTPLEFLVAMYRHPLQKPGDRVAAARAALEYAHRVATRRVQIEADVRRRVDPEMLGKLSEQELETFIELSKKMGIEG